MQNVSLIKDYIFRSKSRLEALNVLYKNNSFADVVRESQEIVELTLKALLKYVNIEVPRIHDVSQIINTHINKMPEDVKTQIDRITSISRNLRRDRELAFYGSEDLTPSEFYQKQDAVNAMNDVKWLVDLIAGQIKFS
jgi:HEPN domain-containing protein